MKIIEAPTRKDWNLFLADSPNGSLLQSWEWGEFQAFCGHKLFRWQFREKETLAQMQFFKLRLGLGRHLLYAPLPPLFNPKLTVKQQKELGELFRRQIPNLSQEGLALRVDPLERSSPLAQALYKDLGFQVSRKHLQPRDTTVLDLSLSEAGLLAKMKPKTRYNVRLAERKGVRVEMTIEPAALETFLDLLRETSRREGFRLHPVAYYRQQFTALAPQGREKLFLAKLGKKLLAAILVGFFGQRATYLHGASSLFHRELMAPHLLQWAAIKEAKAKGFGYYDFWGIAPPHQPDHPWAGISRFKLGFGGEIINYLPAQELTLQPLWHKLYKIMR